MKKIGLFFIFFAFIVCTSFAQNGAKNEKMPIDPEYRIGKLDNGMTYFIRKNSKPESLATFFIARSVGAIQEDDNQDGLAHFLEHMAFNGTKHFPDKALLNYLQSIGAEFGRNVNAYTSQEATVYMLLDIPIKRQTVIDSALLVLYDWSHYISLLPEEVDKERGVIREELRTGQSAGERIFQKSAPYLYNGTKYKDRLVIGTDEGLKNFKQEDIVSFYNEWYRPEYQAIIAVGDFDVDKIEKQIVEMFSKIPVPENARKKEKIVIPDYKEDVFGVITDPEQTTTRINYVIPLGELDIELEDTKARNREILIENLISTAINERLSDLTREANPPFLSAYIYPSTIVSTTKGAFGSVSVKEGGASKGLETLIAQVDRLRKYGMTKDEYDRAIVQMKTGFESAVKRQTDKKHTEYVNAALSKYLKNNSLETPEQALNFANEQFATITLDEVNSLVPKIFPDKNGVILAIAPEKSESLPTVEELKSAFEAGKKVNLPALEDKVVAKSLISKPIKSGKIVKEQKDSEGNVVLNLSNGAKVILNPTDLKQDEVILRGSKKGGISNVVPDDLYSLKIMGSVAGESGLGDFSATELRKVLTGKRASANVYLSQTRTEANGNSSAKIDDIETMLQLLNLKFTAPRFDTDAFNNVISRTKNQLQNYYKEPGNILGDSINRISFGDNKYLLYPSDMIENMDKATLEGAKRLYKENIDGVDGMTFYVVGKFNIDSLKPLVAKYIASLPKGVKRDYKDLKIDQLAGNKAVEFKQPMESPKTTVFIRYSGAGIDYNLDNIVTLNFLRDILRIRYTEIIREEKEATYGVGVGGALNAEPTNKFTLLASFDTNDKVASEMADIVEAEIKKIADGEIKGEDFQKTKAAYLKNFDIDKKENGNVTNWMQLRNEYGINYTDDYINIVNGMTNDKISNLAKTILNNGNMKRIIMYPN